MKPKFSIIVPVYNTEKYLKRCLDSVKYQTYENFECIIVNDGTPDNSSEIIKEYLNDKRFILLDQNNQGLSCARNNGVAKSRGKYISFLDSDDFIDNRYFEIINQHLEKDLDLLKIGIIKQTEEKVLATSKVSFEKSLSKNIVKELIKDPFFEPAVGYIYNRNFYNQNKFKFMKDCLHEDYGLIPIIVTKAKYIKAINNPLYFYVEREGSIMTKQNYRVTIKKYSDVLKQFLNMKDEIKDKHLLSYLATSVIKKFNGLNTSDKRKELTTLKKLDITSYLVEDTLKRKLKKILLKTNLIFFSRYV